MASNAGGVDEWADRFLSAALEPHRWDEALTAMAAATGSRHGQLIGVGPDAVTFNWISEIDQERIDRPETRAMHRPEYNFRVTADIMSDGTGVLHEAHYDAARRVLKGDDYLDLCVDLDIFDGCQTRLTMDDGMMTGLALLRSRKDGRTSQEQRDLFAHIAGHARTAIRLQRAIEQQGFALLTGTFEAMGRACWLLDGRGRVRGMTPRAESLLLSGRVGIGDGLLAGHGAEQDRAILRGIRATVDRPARAASPVILDQPDGSDILLEFHPLPEKPWATPFAPRALIVAREGASAGHQARMLRETWRLTPAEADIALRLASGMTRRQIAAARGVSGETLKAQLRSIYEKTGCSREAQLVRMVALLENG